jgi:exopolysaccharide biosynthesis protein
VLSLSPEVAGQFQNVKPGDVLQISTAASPALHGVRTALSGGPLLVRSGKRQKLQTREEESYEFSSMLERHPRSAIGWNKDWFYLVVVDGRQPELSEGMTIEELSTYLVKLGCDEAMNLDGGGSSTLWYGGDVRNSPCDRYERTIANSLVVVRKRSKIGRPETGRTGN